MHRELGGGELTPADLKDIPQLVASCSAYEVGGRRRKGWKFGIKAFMFPSDGYV